MANFVVIDGMAINSAAIGSSDLAKIKGVKYEGCEEECKSCELYLNDSEDENAGVCTTVLIGWMTEEARRILKYRTLQKIGVSLIIASFCFWLFAMISQAVTTPWRLADMFFLIQTIVATAGLVILAYAFWVRQPKCLSGSLVLSILLACAEMACVIYLIIKLFN